MAAKHDSGSIVESVFADEESESVSARSEPPSKLKRDPRKRKFIRSQPMSTPTVTVIALGKAAGLTLSQRDVSNTRSKIRMEKKRGDKRIVKRARKVSAKTTFVRSLPITVPTSEVVALGTAAGFTNLRAKHVWQIRSYMKMLGIRGPRTIPGSLPLAPGPIKELSPSLSPPKTAKSPKLVSHEQELDAALAFRRFVRRLGTEYARRLLDQIESEE
jgi:hypothetical protein